MQDDPARYQDVRAAKAAAAQARATDATARFNDAHPDAQEILQDPQFQAWVDESKVRKGLLLRAHANYDVDAADEVFSTWKAIRGKQSTQAQDGANS